MRCLAVMAVLALGLSTGGALAKDPAAQKEALAHNAASNAALNAGDVATGMREAEAAWRAAERGWGDNANTAELAKVVATGYIDLGNVAAAREAAARTLALAPHAKSYTVDEARIWHGLSMVADPAAQQPELEAGLAALDARGVVNIDTVRGRLALAALQIARDPKMASATGQKAIADSRAIQSPDLRAHLFELGQIQYLAGEPGPAAFVLAESLNMWEEQPVGVLPKPLADTWAWQAMAGEAGIRSMPKGVGPAPRGGFGGFAPPPWAFVPKRECAIDYADVELPPFPKVEGDKARLGAVVYMFDLDSDGAATNIRIVGSAPAQPQYVEEIKQRVALTRTRRFVREPCRAGQAQTIVYDF